MFSDETVFKTHEMFPRWIFFILSGSSTDRYLSTDIIFNPLPPRSRWQWTILSVLFTLTCRSCESSLTSGPSHLDKQEHRFDYPILSSDNWSTVQTIVKKRSAEVSTFWSYLLLYHLRTFLNFSPLKGTSTCMVLVSLNWLCQIEPIRATD